MTAGGGTTLLSAVGYTGDGGALGEITSAAWGAAARAAASDDALGRPVDRTVTRLGDGATLYAQSLSYDPAGDVQWAGTTTPAGTDTQAFCYDDQGRLSWAGSTGTAPCTAQAVQSGTLTGQQVRYTPAYTYDPLDRPTDGPGGCTATARARCTRRRGSGRAGWRRTTGRGT